MNLVRCLRLAATAVALGSMLATWGPAAWPQTRPIKFVVPYPAGSPSDVLARVLAEEIGRTRGVTMLVENRPGASGTIGTEAVAGALPDGNTLLSISPTFVIDPRLRKASYDPLTSFEPICHLTNAPTVIAVSSDSPYRTLHDLLDAARTMPDALTLAGVGPASSVHIGFVMIAHAANVKMTFVPYAGPGPAVNALLGGHVTSVFVPYPAVAGLLNAGKLRALAISSRTRFEALPDVPTVAESGFRGYEMDIWFGVVAPAKTPNATSSRLADWFSAALQASAVKAQLAVQGLYPVGICGTEFAAMIREKNEEYGRVIRDANIAPE
jgi:tripartite-type tricarboxylate transporter receptor subunit TctC